MKRRSTRSIEPKEEEEVIDVPVSKKRKFEETKVAKDAKAEPAKKSKTDHNWIMLSGTVYHCDYNTKPTSKIASFDLDSTLTITKSGKQFSENALDWLWWHPKVPEILKKYNMDGFKIVLFTNQKGIETGKTSRKEFSEKMNNIQAELGFPIQVFAATSDDKYIKPSLGMWEIFNKSYNDGIAVDMKKSIYVGDAAGRPATKTKKKDFSDSDLKFAKNSGLEFHTPETFFLGEAPEVLETSGFDPSKLKRAGCVFKGEETKKVDSDKQELIIFVGSPGSGKSTFWKNHLKNYVRVNNDTLKTKEKCMKVCEEALSQKKSAVIDNTNPTPEVRKLYIDIAKKHKVPVRCFFFNFPKEQLLHMDSQRKKNTYHQHLSKHTGRIPIFSFFKKNSIPPTTAEGFTEVREVEFIAGPFDNDNDEKAFNSLS